MSPSHSQSTVKAFSIEENKTQAVIRGAFLSMAGWPYSSPLLPDSRQDPPLCWYNWWRNCLVKWISELKTSQAAW